MDTETLELVTDGQKGDRFEAVIPEDISSIFSQKHVDEKPVAAAPVVPAPAPAPVAAAPKKVSAARQAANDRARKIEEANQRLTARSRTTETHIPVLPKSPRRDEVLAKFEETAGNDLKAAGAMLLDEGDARAREYAQTAVAADRDARIKRQEERAQTKWPDWNQKLNQAGIFGGCRKVGFNQDGSVRYANQEMGEAIYSEDNPPEAAYDLADQIIKIRSGQPLDEFEPAAPAPVPAPAPPAVPVAVVTTRNELQEAVNAASVRPKGINALGNAGQPRMSFSREDLDALMQTNQSAYLRLMDSNKELSDWHMGRVE
jgi:hypothetical protein